MLAACYVPSSLPSLVIPGREAQGRVHLARQRCHKAVLILIRRCYSHIRARDRPHGRGVLRSRCAQPSAPVERDTPVPFPSPAQGRPCSNLARRRTVSHVFGAGSWSSSCLNRSAPAAVDVGSSNLHGEVVHRRAISEPLGQPIGLDHEFIRQIQPRLAKELQQGNRNPSY